MDDDRTRREAIRRYYACYEHNDRDTLCELLAEDLVFTSSYACYRGRDAMLDDIWPHVAGNENRMVDLEIFGEGDRFMVRYRLTGPASASMSELLIFRDGRIAEIEVFAGRRDS